MVAALILIGLALTFVCIFGWLWLCAGAVRRGWRGAIGKLAFQLSGVCLAYGMIRGSFFAGVFLALFPPLAFSEIAKIAPFLPFLKEVAKQSAPYGVIALAVCLVTPPLRIWTLGLTLGATLIAAGFVGDAVSKQAMCQSAAKLGFTTFARNSFWWSLANAPMELQVEIHARADVNRQRLGWSYRDLDWFVIPDTASDDVTGPTFTCPIP